MRLHATYNTTSLAHQVFGGKTLDQMQGLYGGEITKDRGLIDRTLGKTLLTADGMVRASASGRRPVQTVVAIKGLDQQYNAVRWTALKAYEAKGGVALATLVTEVPGLRADQEWTARHKGLQIDGFFTSTSQASGSTPHDLLFEGAADHMRKIGDAQTHNQFLGAAAASEGFHAAAASAPEPAHTHTLFHSAGNTLLDAATLLVDEYGQLTFHADDPAVAVAQALGAQNFEDFTATWNGAMNQATPLAAGQFVMRALVQ
jgi:hypothetical protein